VLQHKIMATTVQTCRRKQKQEIWHCKGNATGNKTT